MTETRLVGTQRHDFSLALAIAICVMEGLVLEPALGSCMDGPSLHGPPQPCCLASLLDTAPPSKAAYTSSV